MLADAKKLNRIELARVFSTSSKAIVDGLDAVHALASQHAPTFRSPVGPQLNPAHDVLFACFHKTLLNLHTAHELTLDGLYGLARPHLRQAFESLMIGKHCSCDPESDIFDRWIDGVDLYFSNGILKKLVNPDTAQFQQFWTMLCHWSHATVYASQLSLDLETTVDESGINLALIGSLAECVDHLLCTHLLTPSVRYYAKRYGREQTTPEARTKFKESLPSLRAIRGPLARQLVKDYRAKWCLK